MSIIITKQVGRELKHMFECVSTGHPIENDQTSEESRRIWGKLCAGKITWNDIHFRHDSTQKARLKINENVHIRP